MKRLAIWGTVILTLVVATVFVLIHCGYVHRGLFTGEEKWEQPGETNTYWV
jgi:hypothetical protein